MGIIEGPTGVGGGGTTLRTPKNALSITTDTPGAPSAGDIYVVPVGATGAFAGHDNEIATYGGAAWEFYTPIESDIAYVDDSDDYYLFTGVVWKEIETGLPAVHALGGAEHSADTLANLNSKVSDATLIADWSEAQIINVRKGGNDSNDGSTVHKAFLTIGAAIAKAVTLTPTASNLFVIKVLDAGIYTENVTLAAYIKLDAPDAKIIGTLALVDDTAADVDTVAPPSTVNAVTRTGTATGTAFLRARVVAADSPTSSTRGILVTSGILYVDIDELRLTNNSATGIYANGSSPLATVLGQVKKILCVNSAIIGSAGSTILDIGSIEISGTGSGVVSSGAVVGPEVIRIGRIKDTGSGTGVETLGAAVNTFIIGEIDCDTAYNCGSGTTMNLIVGKVTGTRIAAGTLNLTEAGVVNAHAPDHQRAGADALLAFNEMKVPSGFEDAETDITVSWDNGTKVLTVTPTAATFDVWVQNKKYTKTGAQTKDISGTIAEGLWFFYYDNTGTLIGSQTPWSLDEVAPVALVHWSVAQAAAIYVGWEAHGIAMDWAAHKYLHDTIGAAFESGLAVSGDVTGSGADADDAQVAVADGEIHDEDLAIDPHDGAGAGLFEQALALPAEIPVLYRTGVGGLWQKEAATVYPVKQGAARIQYNLDTAGTWTTPDVTSNGRYMAMWLFATNNQAEPIIAILGQREDITFSNAQDNNQFGDLAFGTLPLSEMKILARVIVQTSAGYGNVPHARTREILDLRASFQQPTGNFVATDHQSLSGRDSTNAHPAAAVQPDASGFVGVLSPADTDLQTALATLDNKAVTRIDDGDSPYAILATDRVIFADTDGGAIVANLPAGVAGKEYEIINVGSSGNDVDLTPDGTEQIQAGGAGVALVLTDGLGFRGSFDATEDWRAPAAAAGGGVVTLITPSDDMSVILNAATSGSSFWLGDGSHVPTAQIDLSGKSNISIMAGRGAVITEQLTTGVIDPLFLLGDNVGLHFHGLRFALTADASDLAVFGFKNGTTSSGITWDDCEAINTSAGNRAIFIDYKDVTGDTNDFHVRNCQISGHWRSLVRLDANAGTHEKWRIKDNSAVTTATASPEAGVHIEDGGATAVKDCQIEGNQFDAFYYGISLVAAVDCSILDNHVYAAGSHGIAVAGTGNIINDNIVDDPTTNGIDITGADNTINGNRITSSVIGIDLNNNSHNCVVSGNSIDTSSSHGLSISGADRATVTGNLIKGSGGSGIAAESCNQGTITGNFIYICAGDGIDALSSNQFVIDGNRVYSAGSFATDHGIRVSGNNFVISDNYVFDPTGSGIRAAAVETTVSGNRITAPVIGIHFEAGSDHCKASGNNIEDASAEGILLVGTSSTITDNTIQDSGTNGIDVTGADNVINSNRIFDATIGIDLNAGSDDCTVSGNSINTTSAEGIKVSDCERVSVTGNHVYNPTVGLSLVAATLNALVDGNYIYSPSAEGITLVGTGGVISNNIIDDPTDNGINVAGADNTINGNRITDAVIGIDLNSDANHCVVLGNSISGGTTGIKVGDNSNVVEGNIITGSTTGISLIENSEESVVEGNRINGNGGVGISVADSEHVIIKGNSVFDTTGNGIALDTVSNSMVEGNLVVSAGGDGIELVDVQESVINGNRCDENTGYGIQEDGDCDENLFAVNHLRGNTTGAEDYDGSNRTESANKT